MVQNDKARVWVSHAAMVLGLALLLFPLWMMLATASQSSDAGRSVLPGGELWRNLSDVYRQPGGALPLPYSRALANSLAVALLVATGKIAVSFLSAYAIVYFRFPLRRLGFALIFATLMLPVEVRIFPTVEVVSQLGLANRYAGLALPLIASATSTFLLRQFFQSLPAELMEAARVDGAGPVRFLIDIVLPLSRTPLAALLVINFIYGWNQYLWPLLINHEPEMMPAVVAIKSMLGEGAIEWQRVMACALLSLLPPLILMLALRKSFVRGLVDSEK